MFSFSMCFSYETLLIVIFVSWKSDGMVRWICDGNQCKFVHIYSSFKNIISYSKNKRKDFNETLTRSRLCVTRIPSVTHRFCQYINRKVRYRFLQHLECARELLRHLDICSDKSNNEGVSVVFACCHHWYVFCDFLF